MQEKLAAARRLAPLSGVVFVGLVVVAFAALGQSTPGIKSSPEKVATFYAAHSGREQGASFLLAIAVVFLVVFAASLRAAFTVGETPAGTAGIVAFAGLLVAAAGFLVGATIHLALADGAHKHHLMPQALQALNALDNDSFLPFSAGLGIMLLGAAVANARTRVLNRWFGWLTFLLGIAIFTPAGFIAFLASGVWIIIVSVLLFWRQRRPASAATG
jgi:hypothetical protein